MNNINIEVCRVARRFGQVFIDCILSCHPDFYFTNLQVSGHFFAAGKETKKTIDFDVSHLKSGDDNSISIPVSEYFDHQDNGIYSLIFYIDDGERTQSTTLYISDVEFMYHCISKQLLSLGDDCTDISDELIQKYLLLHGHQMAMSLHQYEEAKFLYKKMIALCGHKCQPLNPCNCKS